MFAANRDGLRKFGRVSANGCAIRRGEAVRRAWDRQGWATNWTIGMSARKFHEIWIEQCDASGAIKLQYGVQPAFDYLVGEKLVNFVEAAATRPEFARELPKFAARVRSIFTPEEIRTELTRLEREQSECEVACGDDHDFADELAEEDEQMLESPAEAAERARRFALIKELLTTAQLGTA